MADGSVTIRIDGDASGYEKELKSVGAKTKAGLADIKAGIDMAAAAAKSLFSVMSSGVSYNASIEQLQTSFEVMTGSAQKAEDHLSASFSAPPFSFILAMNSFSSLFILLPFSVLEVIKPNSLGVVLSVSIAQYPLFSHATEE